MASKKRLTCGPFVVVVEVEEEEGEVCRLRLPFSPVQWVDLINDESGLLDTCCHQIDEVREMLAQALRSGKWIKAHVFVDVCNTMDMHGHPIMSNRDLLERDTLYIAKHSESKELSPMLIMAWIYNSLKFSTSKSNAYPPSPLHDAAQECAITATSLSFDLTFFDRASQPNANVATFPRSFCSQMSTMLNAARFLATTKPLTTFLLQTFPTPIPSYVIVCATTGQPLTYSPQIFTSRRQAEHEFGIDVDIDQKVHGGPGRSAYQLRLCTVSLDGVKVGDKVPWWSTTDEEMRTATNAKKKNEWDEVGERVCIIDQTWDGEEPSRIWQRGEVVGAEEVEGKGMMVHVNFDDMAEDDYVVIPLDQIGIVQ